MEESQETSADTEPGRLSTIDTRTAVLTSVDSLFKGFIAEKLKLIENECATNRDAESEQNKSSEQDTSETKTHKHKGKKHKEKKKSKKEKDEENAEGGEGKKKKKKKKDKKEKHHKSKNKDGAEKQSADVVDEDSKNKNTDKKSHGSGDQAEGISVKSKEDKKLSTPSSVSKSSSSDKMSSVRSSVCMPQKLQQSSATSSELMDEARKTVKRSHSQTEREIMYKKSKVESYDRDVPRVTHRDVPVSHESRGSGHGRYDEDQRRAAHRAEDLYRYEDLHRSEDRHRNVDNHRYEYNHRSADTHRNVDIHRNVDLHRTENLHRSADTHRTGDIHRNEDIRRGGTSKELNKVTDTMRGRLGERMPSKEDEYEHRGTHRSVDIHRNVDVYRNVDIRRNVDLHRSSANKELDKVSDRNRLKESSVEQMKDAADTRTEHKDSLTRQSSSASTDRNGDNDTMKSNRNVTPRKSSVSSDRNKADDPMKSSDVTRQMSSVSNEKSKADYPMNSNDNVTPGSQGSSVSTVTKRDASAKKSNKNVTPLKSAVSGDKNKIENAAKTNKNVTTPKSSSDKNRDVKSTKSGKNVTPRKSSVPGDKKKADDPMKSNNSVTTQMSSISSDINTVNDPMKSSEDVTPQKSPVKAHKNKADAPKKSSKTVTPKISSVSSDKTNDDEHMKCSQANDEKLVKSDIVSDADLKSGNEADKLENKVDEPDVVDKEKVNKDSEEQVKDLLNDSQDKVADEVKKAKVKKKKKHKNSNEGKVKAKKDDFKLMENFTITVKASVDDSEDSSLRSITKVSNTDEPEDKEDLTVDSEPHQTESHEEKKSTRTSAENERSKVRSLVAKPTKNKRDSGSKSTSVESSKHNKTAFDDKDRKHSHDTSSSKESSYYDKDYERSRRSYSHDSSEEQYYAEYSKKLLENNRRRRTERYETSDHNKRGYEYERKHSESDSKESNIGTYEERCKQYDAEVNRARPEYSVKYYRESYRDKWCRSGETVEREIPEYSREYYRNESEGYRRYREGFGRDQRQNEYNRDDRRREYGDNRNKYGRDDRSRQYADSRDDYGREDRYRQHADERRRRSDDTRDSGYMQDSERYGSSLSDSESEDEALRRNRHYRDDYTRRHNEADMSRRSRSVEDDRNDKSHSDKYSYSSQYSQQYPYQQRYGDSQWYGRGYGRGYYSGGRGGGGSRDSYSGYYNPSMQGLRAGLRGLPSFFRGFSASSGFSHFVKEWSKYVNRQFELDDDDLHSEVDTSAYYAALSGGNFQQQKSNITTWETCTVASTMASDSDSRSSVSSRSSRSSRSGSSRSHPRSRSSKSRSSSGSSARSHSSDGKGKSKKKDKKKDKKGDKKRDSKKDEEKDSKTDKEKERKSEERGSKKSKRDKKILSDEDFSFTDDSSDHSTDSEKEFQPMKKQKIDDTNDDDDEDFLAGKLEKRIMKELSGKVTLDIKKKLPQKMLQTYNTGMTMSKLLKRAKDKVKELNPPKVIPKLALAPKDELPRRRVPVVSAVTEQPEDPGGNKIREITAADTGSETCDNVSSDVMEGNQESSVTSDSQVYANPTDSQVSYQGNDSANTGVEYGKVSYDESLIHSADSSMYRSAEVDYYNSQISSEHSSMLSESEYPYNYRSNNEETSQCSMETYESNVYIPSETAQEYMQSSTEEISQHVVGTTENNADMLSENTVMYSQSGGEEISSLGAEQFESHSHTYSEASQEADSNKAAVDTTSSNSCNSDSIEGKVGTDSSSSSSTIQHHVESQESNAENQQDDNSLHRKISSLPVEDGRPSDKISNSTTELDDTQQVTQANTEENGKQVEELTSDNVRTDGVDTREASTAEQTELPTTEELNSLEVGNSVCSTDSTSNNNITVDASQSSHATHALGLSGDTENHQNSDKNQICDISSEDIQLNRDSNVKSEEDNASEHTAGSITELSDSKDTNIDNTSQLGVHNSDNNNSTELSKTTNTTLDTVNTVLESAVEFNQESSSLSKPLNPFYNGIDESELAALFADDDEAQLSSDDDDSAPNFDQPTTSENFEAPEPTSETPNEPETTFNKDPEAPGPPQGFPDPWGGPCGKTDAELMRPPSFIPLRRAAQKNLGLKISENSAAIISSGQIVNAPEEGELSGSSDSEGSDSECKDSVTEPCTAEHSGSDGEIRDSDDEKNRKHESSKKTSPKRSRKVSKDKKDSKRGKKTSHRKRRRSEVVVPDSETEDERSRSRSRSFSVTKTFDAKRGIWKEKKVRAKRARVVQMDKEQKAKLRTIALKQAYMNMKAGRGLGVKLTAQERALVTGACRHSVGELTEAGQFDVDDTDAEEETLERMRADARKDNDESPFSGSTLRARDANIVMNIRNQKQIPVMTPQEKAKRAALLRLQFPVSSGAQHHNKEAVWTPVEKTTPTPQSKSLAVKAKKRGVNPEDLRCPIATAASTAQDIAAQSSQPVAAEHDQLNDVEHESPYGFGANQSIDIGHLVSERLSAMRRLQHNPSDMSAIESMYHAQVLMQRWAESCQVPGDYFYSIRRQGLMGDRLKKHDWLKKAHQTQQQQQNDSTDGDTSGAVPTADANNQSQQQQQQQQAVAGPTQAQMRYDIGKLLLQRMGWKEGSGLGKDNLGPTIPLQPTMKRDRKGLRTDADDPRFRLRMQMLRAQVRPLVQPNHPVVPRFTLPTPRQLGPGLQGPLVSGPGLQGPLVCGPGLQGSMVSGLLGFGLSRPTRPGLLPTPSDLLKDCAYQTNLTSRQHVDAAMFGDVDDRVSTAGVTSALAAPFETSAGSSGGGGLLGAPSPRFPPDLRGVGRGVGAGEAGPQLPGLLSLVFGSNPEIVKTSRELMRCDLEFNQAAQQYADLMEQSLGSTERLGPLEHGPRAGFSGHGSRGGLSAGFRAPRPAPEPGELLELEEAVSDLLHSGYHKRHPVSVLVETCYRRKWRQPVFVLIEESGPAHNKYFRFKVVVNDVEYIPIHGCGNKKQAKMEAAAVCLQELGVEPG